jgi:hypothetical protein
MEEIAHCKTCGAEEESIFHALFECAWARQFWREVREVTKVKLSKLCPTSWATDLVEGKIADEEMASIILCGCWLVWTERNSVWHGNNGRSVSVSVKWTLDTTVDLARAGKRTPRKARVLVKWKKPNPGVYKINVDASFRVNENNGAQV